MYVLILKNSIQGEHYFHFTDEKIEAELSFKLLA